MEDQRNDCPCKRLRVMVPGADNEETGEEEYEREITDENLSSDRVTGPGGDCNVREVTGEKQLPVRVMEPHGDYSEQVYVSQLGLPDIVPQAGKDIPECSNGVVTSRERPECHSGVVISGERLEYSRGVLNAKDRPEGHSAVVIAGDRPGYVTDQHDPGNIPRQKSDIELGSSRLIDLHNTEKESLPIKQNVQCSVSQISGQVYSLQSNIGDSSAPSIFGESSVKQKTEGGCASNRVRDRLTPANRVQDRFTPADNRVADRLTPADSRVPNRLIPADRRVSNRSTPADNMVPDFNISDPIAENTYIKTRESEKRSVKEVMSSFCSDHFFERSGVSEIASTSSTENRKVHSGETTGQSVSAAQIISLGNNGLCADAETAGGAMARQTGMRQQSDHLTDSGFIEMFSNSVMGRVMNRKNERPVNVGTSLSSSGVPSIGSNSVRLIASQSVEHSADIGAFSKQPNIPFILDSAFMARLCCEQNINNLPSTILVHTFRYLSPSTLLRNVSSVCKYWYNVCRDPDLWREINLKNQHKLTDPILKQLLNFSDRVLKVNLTDCRFVSDVGVRSLVERCLHIQTLKLMRCFDLTDESFIGIGEKGLCSHLHALHLDGCCKITDKTILEVAAACRYLRSLHVNQCTKVTDTGIVSLARRCPRLAELLLDHCDKVTDSGIMEIVVGCPNLTYLNIMSCGVSDNGVKLLSRLSNLTNLDLSNIPRLTPDAVAFVSRHCKKLECINISLNSVMNDGCVAELARNLPGLQRLYCVSCSITDTGLEDIAKFRPTLEALDVGWCQDITDHGVRVISHNCPHLYYFGLIRCDRVTIETIEELVLNFPKVNYSTFVLESRRLLERARREGFQFGLCAEEPSGGI